MDSSGVRAKDAPLIWEKLEENLILSINSVNFEAIEAKTKIKLLKVFDEDRAKAAWPVTDAAFVLNPKILREIRRLVNSRDEDDKAMWETLNANTKEVISLGVHRMFMAEHKSTELSDSLKIEIEEELANLFGEYGCYTKGFGEYAYFPPTDTYPDLYWISKDGSLHRVAMMILNVGVTISDVERLHKSYSRIHSTSRARLHQKRMDGLVLGQFALRNVAKPILKFNANDAFKPLTPEQKDDLVVWSKELRRKLIGKKMEAQRDNGNEVPIPTSTEANESGEDGSGDSEDSDSEFSVLDSDNDDNVDESDFECRRTSRPRVMTKRLRESFEQLKAMDNVESM